MINEVFSFDQEKTSFDLRCGVFLVKNFVVNNSYHDHFLEDKRLIFLSTIGSHQIILPTSSKASKKGNLSSCSAHHLMEI